MSPDPSHVPRNTDHRSAGRRAGYCGFTLVEVCIAIGLISFCLLSVLALMPVGLSTLREANTQTIEANIIRQVSAELLLLPYSEVDGYLGTSPLYFDNEGQQMASSERAIYRVEMVSEIPAYPGAPSGITNNLRSIRIITSNVMSSDMPSSPSITNSIFVRNSGG